VNSVNTFISGVSSRSVGDVSTHGLQSVINALSNRISAGGGTASVTSTELSAVSAQAASAISVASAAATSADAHANAASAAATSVDGRVNSVNTALSALSVRSVGDVSTHGLQSILNALSNRISAGGGTGSVTSAEVQTVSVKSVGGTSVQGLQSVMNALSGRISAVIAGATSVTSAEANGIISLQNRDVAVSAGCPVYAFTSAFTFARAQDIGGTGTAHVLGIVLDTAVATSAIGRVQTQGVVTLSTTQWDQVVSAGAGGLAPGARYYLDDEAGKLLSGAPPAGAIGLAQVVVGVAISPNDLVLGFDNNQHVSAVASELLSAISHTQSVLSQAISAATSSRIAADNVLSLRMQSILSVDISAVSQAVSVVSHAVSVLSHNNSVTQAALSARITSVAAAGGGSVGTPGYVSTDNTISGAALITVSGLSIPVSAGGIYRLEAFLLVNRTTGANPVRLGLTFPTMSTTRGVIKAYGLTSTAAQGAGTLSSHVMTPWNGNSASGSTIVSTISATAGTSGIATYEGVMNVNTGGTIHIVAGASTGAGAITVKSGSYLRLLKIR
jgi:hypothetical protein